MRGEYDSWRAFADDVAVFRQFPTPAKCARLTRLTKPAYTQDLATCACVRRAPQRQGLAPIRRLCEVAPDTVQGMGGIVGHFVPSEHKEG